MKIWVVKKNPKVFDLPNLNGKTFFLFGVDLTR